MNDTDTNQDSKSNTELLLEHLNEQSLAHALVLAYDKDDPNKTAKALAAVLKERLEEVRKELEVDTNTSD